MSDEKRRLGVSRRQLLSAVGGAGTIGVLGGLGSAAFLSDRERFRNGLFLGGALDLELACGTPNCNPTDDGVFQFTLQGLEPGASGTERIYLEEVGNPAWLWLYSSCPTGELAEVLEATVTYDFACDGVAEETVSGSLESVLEELHLGRRLGDRCLDSATRACLEFAWEFPDEPGAEKYKGATADFELGFYAVQCRHNDGLTPPVVTEPCPGEHYGISHIGIWGCLADEPDCECTKLGVLELSDAFVSKCSTLQLAGISENHIEPGVYDLPVDDDCVDSGYDVRVTDTVDDGGETIAIAFELLDASGDPGPDLCQVAITSSTTATTYDANDLAPRSNSTEGLLYAPEK